MSENDNFYSDLRGFRSFSGFANPENYQPIPDTWLVVTADVVNSTIAIERGMYRQVNSVSTAMVIATLNVYGRQALPFVFGGDGASLCVPNRNLQVLRQALAACRQLALESFNLDLRVGIIPVADLLSRGHQILVAKYQPDDYHQQAMFRGGGLSQAEVWLKDQGSANPYTVPPNTPAEGNFEGFECRWNEIPSPQGEVVTLLLEALDPDTRSSDSTYARIQSRILETYGDEADFHPVREANLKLSFSPEKLSAEARIRTFPKGTMQRLNYQAKLWLLAFIGKYVMSRSVKTDETDWGKYKENFIKNTDYRKFDDMLRMVISGNTSQREQLTAYLESLRAEGRIVYGIHVSQSAIATCMVSDYNHNHMHFLDGSHGGYAFAAKMLKQQRAEL